MFNIFELSIIIYILLNDIIFTTSLSLLQPTGTGTNLSTSNLSTLLFKLLKLVGTFFNLSLSDLSTLDYRLTKSVKLAKLAEIPLYQHLLHALNLFLLHN